MIEFKDGAVCFANEKQWFYAGESTFGDLASEQESYLDFDEILEPFDNDFQLNTIKQGDYIEASELDTEQKYNDAVEVFCLFGFDRSGEFCLGYADFMAHPNEDAPICSDGLLMGIGKNHSACKRKITFNQLMAIGELKRLEIEREKSAPKITPDLTPDLGIISSNKYERNITDRQGNSAVVDVYDVLKAFEVTCPATQHALKKLLCSGLRGHKDLQTDLLEAKESITRAIELNE